MFRLCAFVLILISFAIPEIMNLGIQLEYELRTGLLKLIIVLQGIVILRELRKQRSKFSWLYGMLLIISVILFCSYVTSITSVEMDDGSILIGKVDDGT